jgi:hypothetical protein
LEHAEFVFRRLRAAAAVTFGGLAAFIVLTAALIALSFPVAVQLQNRALDDCTASHDGGTVTVHWKSILPPRHVCAVNGREVR